MSRSYVEAMKPVFPEKQLSIDSLPVKVVSTKQYLHSSAVAGNKLTGSGYVGFLLKQGRKEMVNYEAGLKGAGSTVVGQSRIPAETPMQTIVNRLEEISSQLQNLNEFADKRLSHVMMPCEEHAGKETAEIPRAIMPPLFIELYDRLNNILTLVKNVARLVNRVSI